MHRFFKSLVLSFGLGVIAASNATAQGPSFNCAKASTAVERTICASDQLSRLDREMAEVYAALRSQLGSAGRQRLLDDQRAWLSHRNACRDDEACLAQQMSERIAALRSGGARSTGGSSAMPPGLVGHWGPYSDTASRDGVRLSPGVADFGIGGRYEIAPVRAGGRVFRITGRSNDAYQLDCGYGPTTYVAFMRAGKPVIGTGELLEVQSTGESNPLPEPDPSMPRRPLPGSCSMGFYIRQQ